jgi:nucleotide-binding universal stress UspA family protein
MQVADINVSLERVHLVGIEGEAIVKFATEAECDLIVMGTHGYGGFTKLLIGSVADYVLRHAKCPVFVIKDKNREQQSSTQDSAAVG